MNYTPTTELEAINSMLATIGQAPVNSLTGPRTSDVALAQNQLFEASRDVQMEGWSFNTDKDYPLAKAGDGTIPVPSNTLTLKISRNKYTSINPVVRGTKLYDSKNHTFTFATSLVAEKLVTFLPFTDLPEVARRYITIRAARTFSDRILGDGAAHVYTTDDERNARRVLSATCSETEDLNFGNSPGVREIIFGR